MTDATLVSQDDKYANVFALFKQKCTYPLLSPHWVQQNKQLLIPTKQDGSAVRILSIGCGSGEVDCFLISSALQNCPVAVEYVGVDTNVQHIELAAKNMQHVGAHVKVSFENKDIADYLDDNQGLAKFDVILLIHCLYYVSNRSQLLHRCYHELLQQSGTMIIMNQSPAGGYLLQELCHPLIDTMDNMQHLKQVRLSSGQVENILQQVELKYHAEVINNYTDVSSCYESHANFANEGHKLMSFFLECDTTTLSESIVKQIQHNLRAMCVTTHDNRLLMFNPDVCFTIFK